MVKASFVFEDGVELTDAKEAIKREEETHIKYRQVLTEIAVPRAIGAPEDDSPVVRRLKAFIAEKKKAALRRGYIALLDLEEIDELYDEEKLYQVAVAEFSAKNSHFSPDQTKINVGNAEDMVESNRELMFSAHKAMYGSDDDFEDFIYTLTESARQRAEDNVKNYVAPANVSEAEAVRAKQRYAEAEIERVEKAEAEFRDYWSKIRAIA